MRFLAGEGVPTSYQYKRFANPSLLNHNVINVETFSEHSEIHVT